MIERSKLCEIEMRQIKSQDKLIQYLGDTCNKTDYKDLYEQSQKVLKQEIDNTRQIHRLYNDTYLENKALKQKVVTLQEDLDQAKVTEKEATTANDACQSLLQTMTAQNKKYKGEFGNLNLQIKTLQDDIKEDY